MKGTRQTLELKVGTKILRNVSIVLNPNRNILKRKRQMLHTFIQNCNLLMWATILQVTTTCERASQPTCESCTHWFSMQWYPPYFIIFNLIFFSILMASAIYKRPNITLPEFLRIINPLKYQPFLRERVRESASQEWAKRQRGSPRLNSKKLSPPLFCRWRQNPLKQSAQNKCTWAGGPHATWLFHTELHGSIFWGSGKKGGGWMAWGDGGRVWDVRPRHHSPCLLFY